ncbi:hypothetical protein [Mesorhizobium sp. NPDC059025]|uniref:hypothetical protein n=1 Tax=unclassified Mesorhizobium TaxID=325217 RepID=UPI0036B3C1F3
MASSAAFAGTALKNLSQESVDGAGRNIMRTTDGGLVSTYSVKNGSNLNLVFGASLDNGDNWNETMVKGIDGKVHQAAIDSNFQGSYIAFTEERDGMNVGRIAFASAPFADKPEIAVSEVVTPAGVEAQDTFVQASRRGWGGVADENRQTVVYGWQDKHSKSLYVGVSKDGHTFPMAKKVVQDAFATSGPAVAIRGNYVIASYQTTNPEFAPTDVASGAAPQRSYPAYIESMDGGETWAAPKPLFGLKSSDYPMVKVETRLGSYDNLRLAGGTSQPNSPTLTWGGTREIEQPNDKGDKSASLAPAIDPSRDPNNGISFVQTSMMAMDSSGNLGEVSVVSFKPIKPANSPWKHVVANNKLSQGMQNVETSKPNVSTSHFQYSALIDTPIRATSYKEYDQSSGKARLVVAVSTDTGMNFTHHVSFTADELSKQGVEVFDAKAIFSSSQCLFEDRSGEVYLDVLVMQDGNTHYARVPVGVNASQYREPSRS